MENRPKNLQSVSVDSTRKLSDKLANASVDYGRPVVALGGKVGEPRELLQRFHYNYPFVMVAPVPALAQGFRLNNTEITVNLPDGTVTVRINGSGGIYCVRFNGNIGDLTTLTQDTAQDGLVFNPAPDIDFFVYPNKELRLRGIAGSYVTIIPYIATEAAGINQ